MANNFALNNGIKLYYEVFGNENHSPILLIMGNSAQSIMWTDDFCLKMAHENRYVIRFDHRDTGLSSCFDFDINPYSLLDLAKDAINILDALKIKKAHIVGLSMGGSIAQLLAIYYRERVLTITLMMSSPDLSIKNDAFMGKDTSTAKLPAPKKEFVEAVLNVIKEEATTKQEKIKQTVNIWSLCNANKENFDRNYWFNLIEKNVEREELNPFSKTLTSSVNANHTKAQKESLEPNLDSLKLITVPALVIHGSEDPVFPKAHGEVICNSVQNGKLCIVNNMGHALNPNFFDEIITSIINHTN